MADYSSSVLSLKEHQQEVENAQTKIDSTKRDLIPIEANKRSVSKKIRTYKEKVADLGKDIIRQRKQVNSVEKQLKDAQKLFTDFQNKISASVASTTSISPEGQKEYEELRSKFLAGSGSELEEQVSLLLNDKDSLKATKSNLENQRSNAENRIAELESIISTDLKANLHDVITEITDVLDKKPES